MCAHMEPEVNVRCLPLYLPLVFETVYLIEPGAHYFDGSDWRVTPQDLLVSPHFTKTENSCMQLDLAFMWVLGSECRSLCLHSKRFTLWVFSRASKIS